MRTSPFKTAMLGMAALTLVSCADQPTAPQAGPAREIGTATFARGGIPGRPKATASKAISAPLMTAAGVQAGTLDAVVYLTRIDLDEGGQLVGTTRVIGTATTAAGTVPVDITGTAPLSINGTSGIATAAVAGGATIQSTHNTCEVLNLVLGPLHLDLLGLVVDLNQVVLDIVAQSGAGNLLGNLLCAVVGLLDGVALISVITSILERINDILAVLPI